MFSSQTQPLLYVVVCKSEIPSPQAVFQQSDSTIVMYMLFVSQKSPVHKLCSAVRLSHCYKYIYVVICKPEIPSPQAVLSSQIQLLLYVCNSEMLNLQTVFSCCYFLVICKSERKDRVHDKPCGQQRHTNRSTKI